MKRRGFFLLAVLLLIAAVAAADEWENLYQQYKQSYVHFLADPHAQRHRRQWARHIRDFLSFTEKHPTHSRAPDALFVAADAYTRMGHWSGRADAWREAVKVYDRLVRTYPQSSLADDALIKAGQLLERQLGDPTAARQHYQIVLDEFEHGDQMDEARLGVARLTPHAPPADDPPASSSARPAPRSVTIVLDPGHGGDDWGAYSTRLYEKNVTLEIARRVRDRLRGRPNVRVFLTREDDHYLPLDMRTAFANELRADVYVSIHVNASDIAESNGVETYVYGFDGASGIPLEELANVAPGTAGPAGNGSLASSHLLAHALQNSVLAAARSVRPSAADRGVKPAPMLVLSSAHVAAVLVETGFATNQDEGALLANPHYWDVLAGGITEGIFQYLDFLSSPGR
jgi:N-acetylmuramoyl-L-alanine amidase